MVSTPSQRPCRYAASIPSAKGSISGSFTDFLPSKNNASWGRAQPRHQGAHRSTASFRSSDDNPSDVHDLARAQNNPKPTCSADFGR